MIINEKFKLHIKKYFPYFLFIYHLIFSVFAFLFINEIGGDALKYWFVGKDLAGESWLNYIQPGTNVINMITFPLVKYLHLPFWSGFFLFSAFSFIGFYKLWHLIVIFTKNNKLAFYIGVVVILLPNLHLWTSFIGKESLIFVALVSIIVNTVKKKLFSLNAILAFSLIAVIRPHVAIVLFFAFLISYFFKGKLSNKKKWILVGISIIASVVLYFILKKIARITNDPLGRILHIYDYHIIAFRKTNSYVPLDEYPLPYKLFTFYFRPLPFEKTGLLYQIWSLENMILLLLSLLTVSLLLKNCKKIKLNFLSMFSLLFVLSLAVMYVYAYANYGLIARSKIMAMPFLYILIIKVFSASNANPFQNRS